MAEYSSSRPRVAKLTVLKLSKPREIQSIHSERSTPRIHHAVEGAPVVPATDPRYVISSIGATSLENFASQKIAINTYLDVEEKPESMATMRQEGEETPEPKPGAQKDSKVVLSKFNPIAKATATLWEFGQGVYNYSTEPPKRAQSSRRSDSGSAMRSATILRPQVLIKQERV